MVDSISPQSPDFYKGVESTSSKAGQYLDYSGTFWAYLAMAEQTGKITPTQYQNMIERWEFLQFENEDISGSITKINALASSINRDYRLSFPALQLNSFETPYKAFEAFLKLKYEATHDAKILTFLKNVEEAEASGKDIDFLDNLINQAAINRTISSDEFPPFQSNYWSS